VTRSSTLRAIRTDRESRRDNVTAAFLKVRDMIVQGRIAPGTCVVEAELAERLGMSRTPIRGALQLLEREGFIVEQGGGKKSRLRVSPLTKEDATELYMIVGKLEGMAGTLTASLDEQKRTKLCRTLKELNQQLSAMAQSNKIDLRLVFDLDTSFHHEIVGASAGPRLLALHKIVKPQIERYWRLYAHTIVQDLHLSVAEHEQIIAAIAAGNVKAAESALINNWKCGAARIYKLIDQLGERGSW